MTLQSQIRQNQIPNEPQIRDLLSLFQREVGLELNCHHLVTIDSFNAVTQTARATFNYKKSYFEPNPLTKQYEQKLVDFPVLIDCPVVFLGGGGGALTIPVQQGDECLALFNDRDIDNWYNGSSNSSVATPRLHSTADAVILVGLRSLANVLANFNTVGPELRTRSGTSRVAVSNTGVTIDFNGNQVEVTDDGLSVTLTTGVSFTLTSAGKFAITNLTGEFLAALIQILTTSTAGGFPLVVDPASLLILQSMQE